MRRTDGVLAAAARRARLEPIGAARVKAQPDGSAPRTGTGHRSPAAVPARRPASRPAARGYRGAAAREDRAHRSCSTILPAYITATRSAVSAITPRSWVMSSSDRLKADFISRSRSRISRLNRDVERRRRLVRDDERRAGRRGPSRSARAAACRRTAGAGSRSTRAAASGIRTASSSSIARALASRRAARPWTSSVSRNLIADREDRVERRHRLLENQARSRRRAPRASRASDSVSSSRPLNVCVPPAMRPGGCTSRMIDSAVTDFPLPDSPTRPSVSPSPTSKLTSSTAGDRSRSADRTPS